MNIIVNWDWWTAGFLVGFGLGLAILNIIDMIKSKWVHVVLIVLFKDPREPLVGFTGQRQSDTGKSSRYFSCIVNLQRLNPTVALHAQRVLWRR